MFRRRADLFWLALPATIGVVVVGLAVLVPQMRRIAQQSAAITRLEAESRELQSRVENLARERDLLLQRETEQSAGAEKESPASGQGLAEETARRLDQLRLLSQTQDRLAAANASIGELQVRIQQLDEAVAKVTEENRRLATTEAELKDKLADSNRLVDAVQRENKTSSDRLIQLEIRNKRLQEESRQNQRIAEKLSRTAQLTDELEQINRRRENYLISLLRRYREVTDLYRTAALQSEDPGEPRASGGLNLSRLQNAISMADEDLKQLQSLNARASDIQKRLRAP